MSSGDVTGATTGGTNEHLCSDAEPALLQEQGQSNARWRLRRYCTTFRLVHNRHTGRICAGFNSISGFSGLVLLGYLALVILIPSASAADIKQPRDPEFRRAVRSSPAQTMADVRSRFKSLDRRLARLEKYVTSSRYQLDREFDRLKDR